MAARCRAFARCFANVVSIALARVFERETTVPLRVELKPFERIVIGETVLVNSGTRTSFLIDGDAPILREKDTVTPENANTPVKRLYLCVQTMYLKNDIPRYRMAYQGFLRDLRETSPGDRIAIDTVNSACGCRNALQGAQGNPQVDEARRSAAGGLTPAAWGGIFRFVPHDRRARLREDRYLLYHQNCLMISAYRA